MKNSKGVTLVELIVILVLIGILAVFVAPRMTDVTATKAGAFSDKLRADIRHARNLAMTENRRYRVYVNSAPAPASGYAVVSDKDGDGNWGEAGAGEIAFDPAGSGGLVVTLNTGEYTGITLAPNAIIEFDSTGRPTLGGGTVLTVSPGGGTVTVIDQTGAVN
ncbi:MAG TPA: GspH/FimT family pseudopilin [Nitrospirota bacterium]|nr:GspH/FimT family pseudopilin [Nitrospirota bacterium]